MICKECGNKQDEGKFCGLCGGALVAKEENSSPREINQEKENFQKEAAERVETQQEFKTQNTATTSNAESQINENVEIAKEKLSTFLGFFKAYIKKPLNILGNAQNEFTNGIISIVFNLFVLSLAVSLIGKNTVGTFVNYSVIGNLFKLFILLAINTILIAGLSFLLNKFSREKKNYKEFTAIYGAYILPVIIVSLLALLLTVINSNGMATALIFLALALAIGVIPQYLVIILLLKNKSSIDPFYGQLIYMVGAFILFMVIGAITVDSVLGDILNSMSYFF